MEGRSVPCCLLFEAGFSTTSKLRKKDELTIRWAFLQVGPIPRASIINVPIRDNWDQLLTNSACFRQPSCAMANSLSAECTPLKEKYDTCFNAWFEGYLEPAVAASSSERAAYSKQKADEFEAKCGKVWQQYRECIQVRS
jgi:hypothetical protein